MIRLWRIILSITLIYWKYCVVAGFFMVRIAALYGNYFPATFGSAGPGIVKLVKALSPIMAIFNFCNKVQY
jgi:hypothetical protein